MAEAITDEGLSGAAVRHGFFTRRGGTSNGLYASLNCGLGSDDARDQVVENRTRVAQTLGATDDLLCTVYQVHSADVITLDRPFDGDPPKADGLVTKTPGLAIGALAADCAPILFYDVTAKVIGACHAGWRGALAGIGDATVAAMEAIGADRAAVRAVVGPCISQENYEVGAEFKSAFVDADFGNERFFIPSEADGRDQFDLPHYLTDRLAAFGVGSVKALGLCTYADPERFYSYRRKTHLDETDYGRQVSAICLSGK